MTNDSIGAFLALGSSAIIAVLCIILIAFNPSVEKDKIEIIGYIAISLSSGGAGALQSRGAK